MVCVPCIVIPFLLWVFHKYLRPILMKFWPWSKQETIQSDTKTSQDSDGSGKVSTEDKHTHSNGAVTNGHAVTAGGESKKTK